MILATLTELPSYFTWPATICILLLGLAFGAVAFKRHSGVQQTIGWTMCVLMLSFSFSKGCAFYDLLPDTLNQILQGMRWMVVLVSTVLLLWMLRKFAHMPSWDQLNEAKLKAEKGEKRLLSFLHHAPAIVFQKNLPDFRYSILNRLDSEILPTSPDLVIGKTDYDLFTAEIAANIRTHDQLTVSQATSTVYEETYPTLTGTTRTYLVTRFLIPNGGGLPHAVCGIAFDITDRKQLEARLRLTIDQLKIQISSLESVIHQSAATAQGHADKTITSVIENLRKMANDQRTGTSDPAG